MQISEIFLNPTNRLRSGWRATIYTLSVIVFSLFSGVFLQVIGMLLLPLDRLIPWTDNLLEILSWIVLFGIAVLAGWVCARLLEDLPWRSLGWSRHKGAVRDLLAGCIVGSVCLGLAALIAFTFGSLRFTAFGAGAYYAVGKTLLVSGILFVLAAAAEEALFRGYGLQTFVRAGLIWLGVLLTSVPFALIHLNNPNVVAGFTFVNTSLAGIWLAAAYLRTRSMWFPLGIHWAWNWTMAAVLGIPVSGIASLTPNPLFRSSDLGPSWLTGGAYGLEGGAACTIALVVSILFLWRSRLFSATDEMLALTSHEIPKSTPGLPMESNQPQVSE